MLALNLYTTPSNNGGIVLYMDADLGDLAKYKERSSVSSKHWFLKVASPIESKRNSDY